MTNQTAIKPVPLTPANMTPEAYAQKDYVALPAGLKAEMARLSIKSVKTRKGHEGEDEQQAHPSDICQSSILTKRADKEIFTKEESKDTQTSVYQT